ncbi:MAG: hypothetical protein U1A78_07935 [Polyangia bacterium]
MSGSSTSASDRTPLPLPRAPVLLRILAVLSLLIGLVGGLSSLAELNGALLLDRDSYIRAVQQRQLSLYDEARRREEAGGGGGGAKGATLSALRPLLSPLLRLPREEISRLSLLLGDELHERQRVTVPLGLLQLILSWLLLTGGLGTLRRQAWAPPLWGWACTVNIPFSLLSLVVMFVHARQTVQRLGPQTAEALAKVSGRPVERELDELWQLMRSFVVWQAMTAVLGVLLLGATTLAVQRYMLRIRSSAA